MVVTPRVRDKRDFRHTLTQKPLCPDTAIDHWWTAAGRRGILASGDPRRRVCIGTRRDAERAVLPGSGRGEHTGFHGGLFLQPLMQRTEGHVIMGIVRVMRDNVLWN